MKAHNRNLLTGEAFAVVQIQTCVTLELLAYVILELQSLGLRTTKESIESGLTGMLHNSGAFRHHEGLSKYSALEIQTAKRTAIYFFPTFK